MDDVMRYSEVKEFIEWLGKALLMGIAAFGVSYLSDISKHISSLDIETVQMRTELKSSSGFQAIINGNVMRDLERITSRLEYVEKNYLHK